MRRSARPAATSVRSVNYATSPLLASKTPPSRSRFVVLLVGLAFALLLGQALHVQIIATDFYQAQGEKRFMHRQPLPASRGRILDRNGLVLATSVAMPSVQLEPKTFAADAAQRKALARLVGLSSAELDEKLAGATTTVTLRRHLEEPAWQAIQALQLKGVHEVREYQRRYPGGEAAAHVVGFTDIDGRGQEGIELGLQTRLEGHSGQRTVLRDRLGQAIESVGDRIEPVNGADVVLSIDSKIQFFAYQQVRAAVKEHAALAGSAVVLDALSGEILALANYPSFDPARRHELGAAQVRNRALTDVFEPGSTMKPFTAALALESGRVTPATLIHTAPGWISIAGFTIKDTRPHGTLTVAEVIQKSSNVGSVKMALQMAPREMWQMYTAIGLGQKPRVDFPGAVSGRLRPLKKTWKPIDQASMSYGYGLSVSLLQLARAYTVFARDGELAPLSILHLPAGPNGPNGPNGPDGLEGPQAGARVFSAQTAAQVRDMLRLAAGPGGTAPKAQAIGYSVGGKSGTARSHEAGAYTQKHRAWFVGLAPANNPRIVVAVMVDGPSKGGYVGGDVAAPVFSQVVQQTLRMMNVAPDIDVKPQAAGKPVATERESF